MKFKSIITRNKKMLITIGTVLFLLTATIVPLFNLTLKNTFIKEDVQKLSPQSSSSEEIVIGDPVLPLGDPKVQNIITSEYFTTIQAAIDDSDTINGHILEVNSSTYVENIIIDKSLTIRGNYTGVAQPVLDGGGGIGFIIIVNNVTIENINVSNSSTGISCNHSGLAILNNTFWFDNRSIDLNYTSNFNTNTNFRIYDNSIENNSFFINTTDDYDGAIIMNLALNYQNHSGSASIGDFTITDNHFLLNDSHAYAVLYNQNSLGWLTGGSISIGVFNFSENIVYKNNSGNNGVYFIGSLNHLTDDSVIVDDIIVSNNTVIDQTNAAFCLQQYTAENWTGTTNGVIGDILVMNNTICSSISSDGIQISQIYWWDLKDDATLTVGNCRIEGNNITVTDGYAIVFYMDNVGNELQDNTQMIIGNVSISANVLTAGSGLLIDFYQCGYTLWNESSCFLGDFQIMDNTIDSSIYGVHIQQFSYLGSDLHNNANYVMGDIHLDENHIQSGSNGIYFSQLLIGENLSESSACSVGNITMNDNQLSSNGDGILFIDNVSFFRLGNSMNGNSVVLVHNIEVSRNTINDSDSGIFLGPCRFGGENDQLILDSYNVTNNSISFCSIGLETKNLSISSWCQPIIKNNTIDNCSVGIWFNSSYGNLIYNNFFDNTLNAKDNTDNTWNVLKTAGANIIGGSSLGGNYWSDYMGMDGDNDTLGDIFLPYKAQGNISTGGDLRPLTLVTGNITLTSPTDFTAAVVSTTQINLAWVKGIHAVYTRVMQKTGGYPVSVSDGSLVYNGTGVSCSNASLSAGVHYYFRAWSWNDSTQLWSTSNASASNTTWITPLVPTDFLATTIDVDEIIFTWTKGGYATHTRIQRNSGSYPKNVNDGTMVYNGTSNTTSDSVLAEEMQYYYRAWSWNSTSHLWSATNVSASNTTWSIPHAPTSVHAITAGVNKIDVTWTKGTHAVYTRVMQKTGGYPVSVSDGSLVYNGTGVSCSNASLSAGVHYYFRAWSWNISTRLFSSTNVTASNTTWNVPLAPIGFTVTTIGNNQMNLSWTKGSYADITRIQQNTTGYPEDVTDGSLVYNGTGVTCSLSSLSLGTRYYFRAWSWNETSGIWSAINSSASNITGPFAPTGFIATAISTTRIDLAWNKGTYANYTRVQRKTGSYPINISDGVNVCNDTNSSYSNSDLSMATQYYYRAWSWNETSGVWSITNASASATTKGTGGGENPPPSSENEAPTAEASGPYTGYVNQSITLNAAGSSDDVEVVGYRWDWTDDGTWDTDWLSSSKTAHIFTTIGNYTVHLQVQDVEGLTDDDDATVLIKPGISPNQAPVADTGGPYSGLTFQKIQFDGSRSYAMNSSIVNYTWVFGDGTYGYDVAPIHVYESAGTFTVILTVNDSHELKAIDTTEATIVLDANRNNISDIIDQAIGAEITRDDLHTLSIDGGLYYLVDTNHDGIYDAFYNPKTNTKTLLGEQDKKQLIDIDGDGHWDVIYDPVLDSVTPYVEVITPLESPLFIGALIAVVFMVIVLVVWLYKTGRI
jgi:hypothetical protein